jgi:4-amino-4-deoxy-L-arabinose transferase-like glycosyltransferase
MSTSTAALRHGQDLMSDGSARGFRTSFPWQFRRFFSRQRHWLILCLATLYLANISSQWREFPDSATYMLLAESLTAGQGYEIHGTPHGKYPPGFPVYLSLMYRMGLGDMLTLNIFMCGMSFLALYCSYKLLRLLAHPLSALVATLVCGFLFELYRVTGAQLSDVPFLLLISSGLWLLLKGLRERSGWMEAAAVILVVSCWVRVLGIPLCLGIVCGILLSARRYEWTRAIRAAAILTVGSLGTAFWLFLRDRGSAADRALSSYSTELSAVTNHGPLDWIQQTITNFYHSGSFLSRLLTGQEIPAWLALWILWLPLLVGVAYAFVRKRQWIPILAATAYLGSILILRVPLARYLLPIAPLILLYLGQGIQIIAHAVAERFPLRRRYQSGFVWACAALLIVCNLPKDLRYAYRTHHPARVVLEGRLGCGRDVEISADRLVTRCSICQ